METLQYILPANSVVYFGCVGKDKYAETLQAANKEAGLAVRYLYDPEQPTGRCGVIITGHDRSMCTDLAAANCYKIEHLKENWSVVEKAKAYFVGGYHLTVCVPAAMALAEEAAKTNKVSDNCLPTDIVLTDHSHSSSRSPHHSSHSSSRTKSTRPHLTGITSLATRPRPFLTPTRTTSRPTTSPPSQSTSPTCPRRTSSASVLPSSPREQTQPSSPCRARTTSSPSLSTPSTRARSTTQMALVMRLPVASSPVWSRARASRHVSTWARGWQL